jgi:hypothetical protein
MYGEIKTNFIRTSKEQHLDIMGVQSQSNELKIK